MPVLRRTVGALLVISCLAAAPAAAGTYRVHSCALLDGRVIPTDGWRGETAGAGATAAQLCSYGIVANRGLQASLTGNSPPGSYAGWAFTAAANTTISGYTLWRAAHATSGGSGWFHDYIFTHDAPRSLEQRYLVEFCSRYVSCDNLGIGSTDRFSSANRLTRSHLEIRRLYAFMMCDALYTPQCAATSDNYGSATIHAAQIDLTDPYQPVLDDSPRGSLIDTAGPIEGERTLSLSASDRGAGIERLGVIVDGQPRYQRPADINASRCRRPFTTPVPCPFKAEATLVFDTATLPNGQHTVQASVTDAAGNETRSEPVAVTTRNGSRPNGRGASGFVRLAAWVRSRRKAQRASAVVPYGSVRTADGRLTDASGKPIAGAVLDVASKVERPGARSVSVGTVVTRDDGRFSYRLKRGASRRIGFAYKAYTLDPAPVSTATVTLGVRAGLRVKLRPRSVRNGQKVSFRGRLLGGPGRKGTRVTIDVLVPDARRRVPIGNVRADAKGRFRFTYRFRRTLVQARYRFQARLVAQPGYPYRGATSRRVSVLVRP
jgi:hypothetical protein